MTPATIEALILGDDTDLPAVRTAAKQAVPTLVAALQSDRWLPQNAAEALGLLGPAAKDAANALTRALENTNGGIRKRAARALVRILPADEAVPVFVRLLKHENPDYATTAAEALALLGPQARSAAPVLRRCLDIEPVYDASGLNDKYRWLRYAAIEALGRIGTASDEVVPALITQLTHENDYARRDAAEAIGRIGPEAKAAVPALIQVVNRGDESAEFAAIAALGQIGPAAHAAKAALVKLAKNQSQEYRPQKLRESATKALRLIESEGVSLD